MSRNLARYINEEPLTPKEGRRLLNKVHSAAHQPASAQVAEQVRPIEEDLADYDDLDKHAINGTIVLTGIKVHVRPAESHDDGKRLYVVEVERTRTGQIIATQRLTSKQYDRFLRGVKRQIFRD